jgi:hemolysin III
MAREPSYPTMGEEIANSITHGIGSLLSIVGMVVLIIVAAVHGTAWHIVGAAVFGGSLILLYLCSTLYHALPGKRVKRVFKILDHSAIYILIAGTYTPFAIISLRGSWGWSLLAVIWTLAITGVVLKSVLIHRLQRLSTVIYVLMGWLALVAIRPLLHVLPWHGFVWLLAGGLAYTAGVIFYSSRYRYSHAVWHLFVIAGSVCHYCAVYLYVVPRVS